jgi:hypothetical protein
VDRLGDLYTFQNSRVEKRALPKVPNNVDAFLASNAATLNQATFRVHDVEYLDSLHLLVVSHELFDLKE